jgi:hypothetical protein
MRRRFFSVRLFAFRAFGALFCSGWNLNASVKLALWMALRKIQTLALKTLNRQHFEN